MEDTQIDRRFWDLTNRRKMILLADTMKAFALSDDYNPRIDQYVPLAFFGGIFARMLESDREAAERELSNVEQLKLKGKSQVLFGHELEEE